MDLEKIKQISDNLNERLFHFTQGNTEKLIPDESLVVIIAELNVAVNFGDDNGTS